MSGDALLQQLWTTSEPGDVVLAPRRQGDVAAISMDGSTEFHIRRDAFLAAGGKVELSTTLKGLGLGADGLFNYRATGVGTLAITGHGGLYRLVLAPHEEYLVSPRHLVAWDAAIDPAPEIGAVGDDARAALREEPEIGVAVRRKPIEGKEGEGKAAEYGRRALEGMANAGRAIGRGVQWVARMWIWRLTKMFTGDRGLYRLRGPGEFFIASRIEPSFSWLRE
ncbi:hypothetical protein HK101_008468 [Irineochytrium annulatum]|nr:hypothetical protein HK101_008468 [Irineochytrium annulatum]